MGLFVNLFIVYWLTKLNICDMKFSILLLITSLATNANYLLTIKFNGHSTFHSSFINSFLHRMVTTPNFFRTLIINIRD